MIKKILKISTIVLGIIALGLLYYYFFFAKPKMATVTAGTTSGSTNFFPFGQGSATSSEATASSTAAALNETPPAADYLEKLRLISDVPVAGSTFFDTKTTETIRYMEKATGHIYEVATNADTVNEISNTTVPQVHEAFFTNAGQGIIARSVESDEQTIDTWYAKIPPPIATTTQIASATSSTTSAITPLSLISLPTNITFLAVSPSGANIFYLQKNSTGSTGITALPNGSSKKQVWNSPIESLIPQFAGENSVFLTSAPNASVYSYLYSVNIKNAATKSILGNIIDLSVTANQTGSDLVYSTNANGAELFHFVLATNTSTELTPATFGEKCAFDQSNTNNLYCAVPTTQLSTNDLDNWYLGLTSYSDDIWKYDLKAGTSEMIEDLQLNANRSIDAINLEINPTGTLLLFTSKTDGSLWSLNIGE